MPGSQRAWSQAARNSARRHWAGQALGHLAVGGVGVLFAFPFVWMVLSSFKTTHEILDIPPTVVPQRWTFDNYHEAVTAIPFFRYTLNTLAISGVCVVGTLISCSLVAFSLSRVPLAWT